MNRVIHMVVVLTTVGLLSAIALVSMFQYANPFIEENRRRVLQTAILEVLPEARSYQIMDEKQGIYQGLDAADHPVGYAFVSEGSGYQGKIRMMVGMSLDVTQLKGLQILENVETPGLGAKIDEKGFKDQFVGLEVLPQIEYVQNRKPDKPNAIQAITGATISSRSVVKALNNDIERVKRILESREGAS